jgi:hypothetical protein
MSKIPTPHCLWSRKFHKTEKVFVLRLVKDAPLCAESKQRPLKDMDMKFLTSFAVLIAASLLLSGCSLFTFHHTHEWKGGDASGAEVERQAVEPPSLITPMTERRETLVATGYAVISIQNHRNPAQQRLLAIRASKLDAYRALTEQVYGQQLDASTTVADMTVTNDTFRARVEGVIYGAELVSITPVGDDTYETTLSLNRQVVNDLRALYIAHLNNKRR